MCKQLFYLVVVRMLVALDTLVKTTYQITTSITSNFEVNFAKDH